MKKIWLFDTADGNYESFLRLEDARDFAYKKLIEWGYDPEDEDTKEIFDEFEKSYKDEKHPGFWVDELFWCYEINFHND